MTPETITYKQMNELLVHLGFSRRRVKAKWLRYEHTPSDLVIVMVDKKPNELVRVTDAVSARRHLVEKGLITEEELDRLFSLPTTAEVSAKKA